MSNSSGIGTSVGIGIASGAVTAIIGAVTAVGVIGYNIQKSIEQAQKQEGNTNKTK